MTIAFRSWDETDVPAVEPIALSAAFSIWQHRERQGLVLVGDEAPATSASIEAAVIAMAGHPADGLAVLARLRVLTAALSSRRLRYLLRPDCRVELSRLVEAAACARLNARWGISPLKLSLAAAVASPARASRAAA